MGVHRGKTFSTGTIDAAMMDRWPVTNVGAGTFVLSSAGHAQMGPFCWGCCKCPTRRSPDWLKMKNSDAPVVKRRRIGATRNGDNDDSRPDNRPNCSHCNAPDTERLYSGGG